MRFVTNLKVDEKKAKTLNRVIVQDAFHEKIEAIRKINLNFIQPPTILTQDYPISQTSSQALLSQLEPTLVFNCDPKLGMEYSRRVLFGGYDESKAQFLALEGEAQLTTHVVTQIFEDEIIPCCKVSFYFYSQSELLFKQSKYVKYSKDITKDSNLDYVIDRNEVILDSTLEDSILFIDGPLIGGNISSYNLHLVDELHRKNILPIFIIKNSDSNIVVDNLPELRGKYNSDLHWAYSLLKAGQRTAMFKYTDQVNPKNTKIFCYIKPFNKVTTQRIEFSLPTYNIYSQEFFDIFNLIYYLILDHGSETNPQVRPIVFSENYAREILKLINFERILMNSSLVPIMNETRFGG